MKTIVFCLLLSLIAISTCSASTWEYWNTLANGSNYIDNFAKPPIPANFYRNNGTGSFPYTPFMKNQYMYGHTKSSTLKIYCSPRSYLVNSTHCIRDPAYWPLTYYTRYCTPNVSGNIKTDIFYSILVQVPTCNIFSRPYSQSECCYITPMGDPASIPLIDVEDITVKTNSTILISKESKK